MVAGIVLGGLAGTGLLGVGGLVGRALYRGFRPWMGWAAIG